jgi:hypothetical protein
MATSYLVSSSTVVPVSPEEAFQGLLDAPLERLFPHRSGPMPAITRCEGQDGPWGTVGQTRRIVLSDGTGNCETLVGLTRPSDYRYRVTDIEGSFRLLVSAIDGRFTFEPATDGTRVTWSWTLHGRNPAARLAFPALGFFWRRWAAGMWTNFAALVTT